MWQSVEQTQGVYTWTALDAWVDGNWAQGIDLCLSLIYMPSFYSANPAQASSLNAVGVGSGGPLTALGRTGYSNFVTAAITRYKNRGTPFTFFQSWEEPWWPISLSNGYWWGTQAEMVDLAHLGYTAAKSADSTITVLSPSASPPISGPSAWINTAGSTYPAVTGHQTYDEYGVDLFGYGPTKFQWGFDLVQSPYASQLSREGTLSEIVTALRSQQGGNLKPLCITSLGGFYDGSGTLATYFNAQPAIYRKRFIARMILEAAALGVTRVIWYGADSWTTISGGGAKYFGADLVNDTQGSVAGFTEVAAAIQGKTMTWCGVRGDGQMLATFSDGSSYTI